MLLKRAKSLVGLDIGSSAVKAVELKASGKGYKVVGYGVEPIPPDSIVDGAIIDGSAVADAIRRLFTGRKIKTKDVAASLSGNAVIVKKITLPQMTEAELAESIYWEAEQYIPFDIQDVNLDYKILESGGEKGTMDVLLVAAKKEKIADDTGVIAQAGRAAVAVDVDAFALQNAYQTNYGVEPGQVVVLLNVGASATNINIISGEQSVFTRDISIGGNAYTEALQKELNLPFEAADALKRGQAMDGAQYEEARPVLRAVSENVMLEIQKTFDFFKATTSNDKIDRIVVSGGGSRVEAFFEQLRERFDAPIEAFDPFRNIAFDARKFGDASEAAPTAVVAVGLALRRVGDRFINLLAVERERTKRRPSAGLQPAQKVAIAATLILVLTVLGLGWRYWSVSQQLARLDSEIEAAEAETRRLRLVLSDVQKFETRRAQLQERVALIEELRKGQSGPVHLLDSLSRALPDRLWLTQLTQAGDPKTGRMDVTMQGVSTSLTSLSDLVGNLESSGAFLRPVEILQSAVETQPQGGDLVRFTVKATFQASGGPAVAPAAAPPAAARR
ncbi:MAG: type IV pilus assembly protein PilM [Acidobacteria bacterium]|nr:type IV pilus assembly protein PilM [Acidobacteriota bacterium]